MQLVQKRDTGKVYALKTLKKLDMLRHQQLAHVRAERDLLAESQSPWVVQLYCSFQDEQSLHLLMEFLPGGDMMTLLIDQDIFAEDMARNLKPAKDIGMTTLWVNNGSEQANGQACPSYIDHETHEITAWLTGLSQQELP